MPGAPHSRKPDQEWVRMLRLMETHPAAAVERAPASCGGSAIAAAISERSLPARHTPTAPKRVLVRDAARPRPRRRPAGFRLPLRRRERQRRVRRRGRYGEDDSSVDRLGHDLLSARLPGAVPDRGRAGHYARRAAAAGPVGYVRLDKTGADLAVRLHPDGGRRGYRPGRAPRDRHADHGWHLQLGGREADPSAGSRQEWASMMPPCAVGLISRTVCSSASTRVASLRHRFVALTALTPPARTVLAGRARQPGEAQPQGPEI